MQGTGNINYSFDKTKFNYYIKNNSKSFYPKYLLVTLLCFIFICTLYYQKNMESSLSNDNIKDNSLKHFFYSLSINSPLNLIEISKDDNGFVGFSQKSYIILICIYAVAYFYLVQSLIKNLIFSIIVNIIQTNPENNPYNNPDCVIKNKELPDKVIKNNYSGILFLTVFFLIPFLTSYILQYLDIDNYSIKHSYILPWIILFTLIFPFYIIVIFHSGNKNIDILGKLNEYLEPKDYKYVEMLQTYFNTNYFNIFIYLFIILVFALLHIIYYTYNTENRNINIIYILLSIFVLIPLALILFGINSLFGQLKFKGAENDIQDIENNGVSNIYQLIVKYNYPCFRK